MRSGGSRVRTDLRDDGVLLITLNRPPGNVLDLAMRQELLTALAAAPGLGARAVVLRGAGGNFSAALVGAEDDKPTLGEICAVIEAMTVPVVALIEGVAAGAGAAIALAAHGRVAPPSARLSFPDVALGLVPGGGVTQRLSRLVGAADALQMMLRGHQVKAPEALATGLIDVLAEGDPLEEALALALSVPPPCMTRLHREGMADAASYVSAVAVARADAARTGRAAPIRIVDCVEAALILPFEAGLAYEAVAREELVASPEARAMTAFALAERRVAARPAGIAAATPLPVETLVLNGSSPQLTYLAVAAVSVGMRVSWVEASEVKRAENLSAVHGLLDTQFRRGGLSAAQRDAGLAQLDIGAIAPHRDTADLVIYSGPATLAAGQRDLRQGVPQLVIGGASGALGLAVAPSYRLAELALPEEVAPEDVVTALEFLRLMGLLPVIEGRIPLVGRRAMAAGRAALDRCLRTGVPRGILAAALEGFGQRMPDLPDPATPVPLRSMSEDEVLRRWLGAIANEGMRLIEGGFARRPSDIDLVLVVGFGFPRRQGGPMHQAGERGLMVLRHDLRTWATEQATAEDAALWKPHPLIDRMIGVGQKLADLDAG